jgi:hypothetical protein
MAKKKLKTWANYTPEKGVENTEKSLTMPDMSNDPRTVLENHVRGINPITGMQLCRITKTSHMRNSECNVRH